MQWSILTIRNLCDDNQENQNVIQKMQVEGLATHAMDLRAIGVDAELQGDKIHVRPAKMDKWIQTHESWVHRASAGCWALSYSRLVIPWSSQDWGFNFDD